MAVQEGEEGQRRREGHKRLRVKSDRSQTRFMRELKSGPTTDYNHMTSWPSPDWILLRCCCFAHGSVTLLIRMIFGNEESEKQGQHKYSGIWFHNKKIEWIREDIQIIGISRGPTAPAFEFRERVFSCWLTLLGCWVHE